MWFAVSVSLIVPIFGNFIPCWLDLAWTRPDWLWWLMSTTPGSLIRRSAFYRSRSAFYRSRSAFYRSHSSFYRSHSAFYRFWRSAFRCSAFYRFRVLQIPFRSVFYRFRSVPPNTDARLQGLSKPLSCRSRGSETNMVHQRTSHLLIKDIS